MWDTFDAFSALWESGVRRVMVCVPRRTRTGLQSLSSLCHGGCQCWTLLERGGIVCRGCVGVRFETVSYLVCGAEVCVTVQGIHFPDWGAGI